MTANAKCPICSGLGWVCENHPDRVWSEELGCQCGAGMPCKGVAADGLEEPNVSGVSLCIDPEIICSASSNSSIYRGRCSSGGGIFGYISSIRPLSASFQIAIGNFYFGNCGLFQDHMLAHPRPLSNYEKCQTACRMTLLSRLSLSSIFQLLSFSIAIVATYGLDPRSRRFHLHKAISLP
jgi:hypothetical protein